MNDVFLMVAGAGGILIAIAHGVIGQRKILKHLTGPSPVMLRLNSTVFQLSTLYWGVGGVALLLAPVALDPSARPVVAVTVAFLYLAGALGNIWITQGRHFGGYALALAAVLALLGG